MSVLGGTARKVSGPPRKGRGVPLRDRFAGKVVLENAVVIESTTREVFRAPLAHSHAMAVALPLEYVSIGGDLPLKKAALDSGVPKECSELVGRNLFRLSSGLEPKHGNSARRTFCVDAQFDRKARPHSKTA